jgi:hypothetical protein
MLSKEQLLATVKRPTEKVKLEEFGGEVLLRGMSAGELMSFQKSIQKPGKKNGQIEIDEETFGAKLLVRCLVDKSGNRLFHDDEWQSLNDWPVAAFQKATSIAMKLNGYSGSAEGNG